MPPTVGQYVRVIVVMMFVVSALLVYSTHDSRAELFEESANKPHIIHPSTSPAPLHHICAHYTLGGLLIVDSDGSVCERFALCPRSGCCRQDMDRWTRSCRTCAQFEFGQRSVRDCCQTYEFCISCCMREMPVATSANHTKLRTCANVCRTNSSSLDYAGRYLNPEYRYCMLPTDNGMPVESPSPSKPPSRNDSEIVWLDM